MTRRPTPKGTVFAKRPPTGWKGATIAGSPKPDKQASPAWTWRDQPPRFEHANGFSVALYEAGVRAGMALEHARTRLPEKDCDELAALLVAWLMKHEKQSAREERAA